VVHPEQSGTAVSRRSAGAGPSGARIDQAEEEDCRTAGCECETTATRS